jgi:hypothetical protein
VSRLVENGTPPVWSTSGSLRTRNSIGSMPNRWARSSTLDSSANIPLTAPGLGFQLRAVPQGVGPRVRAGGTCRLPRPRGPAAVRWTLVEQLVDRPDRGQHPAVLMTYPANGGQQSQLAIDSLPVAHAGNPQRFGSECASQQRLLESGGEPAPSSQNKAWLNPSRLVALVPSCWMYSS